MSNTKITQYPIKNEFSKSSSASDVKVSQAEGPFKPVIKEFEMSSIHQRDEREYSKVKAKFGPLAATDSERISRTQKDRRFSLNPLLREPLSVEEEERRVIDERVKEKIDALAEEATAKATEVGYNDGLKKGYEEAHEKFKSEGLEGLAKFDELVQAMNNAKADIFRANERFLIELVFRISKLVVLRELSVDSDYVLRLAKELINKSGVRDNITIKINPEDAHTMDQLREGVMKTYGQMQNLNIESSVQVKRGGCQIETEWNAIDASVEEQLEGIYKALVGRRSGGGS